MINVGIVGVSGYMGGEVLRLLLDHPHVHIAWVASRQAGNIADFHAIFYGLDIELIRPEDITPCDVVFLALPTQASLVFAPKLIDWGCKVIDLGSAFRLTNRTEWEQVYQQPHTAWALAEQAVYGLNELHDQSIKQAQLIANPGCYSSAAILAMAPLIKEKCIDPEKIVITGLSGTAGAGATPSRVTHHPEMANNLVPYNVVNHRHSYEIEQQLSGINGQSVSVHFTPVYVPVVRGILNICHGFLNKKYSREALLDRYRDFYHASAFVKIYDKPKEALSTWQYKPYPWVNAIIGTNYCFIGLEVDEKRNRVVVFSVLDSLGKGGAQVGIENMNLMCGFDRACGLTRRGIHPI